MGEEELQGLAARLYKASIETWRAEIEAADAEEVKQAVLDMLTEFAEPKPPEDLSE